MEQETAETAGGYWWRRANGEQKEPCATAPRPGNPCPDCGMGELDYDSLFVLVCPQCSYVAASGAFT
jgi:hypothetical protein